MSQESHRSSALVTGGARRIGAAICRRLNKLGYQVAIQYHSSQQAAEKLRDEILETGGRADIFRCDLLDTGQTRELIPQVLKTCPDLAVLVNNASVFKQGALGDEDLAQMEQHMHIHCRAPFILSQMFARHCQQGCIVNILDTHVAHNRTRHFTYLLSKKSLLALTEMAAVELAPGIRVNGIAPGLILPPEGESASYLGRMADGIPLKRQGSLENIEDSVEFLLKNDFLTGQVLFNDGGEHLL